MAEKEKVAEFDASARTVYESALLVAGILSAAIFLCCVALMCHLKRKGHYSAKNIKKKAELDDSSSPPESSPEESSHDSEQPPIRKSVAELSQEALIEDKQM